MRIFAETIMVVLIALLIGGCSTGRSTTQVASNFINKQQVVMLIKDTYTPKNPRLITLYANDQSPHTAYRVIGIATVSKHNLLGMERREPLLKNMMKNLAASVGGDGLIEVKNKNDAIEAQVIQFQKILI